jgi:acyl-CoA ligase (AMP-forming) (exosortase A-associated)
MDYLLHHTLWSSAERFPDRESLIHLDERLTYRNVAEDVSALAAGLKAADAKRGDRVGIYLDASVPLALSIYAIAAADGVFVPINSVLLPDQVKHIIADCTMSGLITTRAKLISLHEAGALPSSLKFAIVLGEGENPAISIGIFDFDRIRKTKQDSNISCRNISKDLGAILYTSGSTGKPKGVMLSHANLIAGANIVSTYLRIVHTDRILAVLPFSFDAGLNQLTTAFQQGASITLISFVFAHDIVKVLLKERITGLAGVPTVWSLLAQPNSSLAAQPLPDLRYITNTGGAMPQNVLALLRRALPATKIFLMYGLTEAFRSTYLPPDELDRRPTSMGKAIPDTEILVINERGERCGPGEIGELVHRGPTVSMGYWGRPEDTQRVLRPNPLLLPQMGDSEKVCYSGDLVKADDDGFLYFVGRRDTMIKSSGFRISPTEIEEALFSSGKIRGAAVIGIPDEVLGQAIKAFVVPKDGERIESDALLTHCAEKLPRYMLPKTIELIKELPKTSSGKVDYPSLRRREGL